MAVKIGINGFGRIGRCTLKQCLERDEITVVGINDLAHIDDLAYLLKYDSIHGRYLRKVSNDESSIQVEDERISFFSFSGGREERVLLSF